MASEVKKSDLLSFRLEISRWTHFNVQVLFIEHLTGPQPETELHFKETRLLWHVREKSPDRQQPCSLHSI